MLHRRSTPGLILRKRFSVSKQGRKTDFHDPDHLFQSLGIRTRMVCQCRQIMKIFLNGKLLRPTLPNKRMVNL